MADSETAGRTTIETPDLVKGLFDPEFRHELNNNIEEYGSKDAKERKVLQSLEDQTFRLQSSEDQKRVRPYHLNRLLEASGIDLPFDQRIQTGSSVELIHMWTKYLDDNQDNDDVRNGEKAPHALMRDVLDDNETADWIATNHILDLKSRAYRPIKDLDEAYVDASTKLDLLEILWEAEEDLAVGQNLDLLGRRIARENGLEDELTYNGGDFDLMDYNFETNDRKTAALFRANGQIVEELMEDYEGKALTEYGNLAGQAFQMWDDALDFERGRLSDLEESNYNVPITIAQRYLETHPEEEKNELGDYLSEVMSSENPHYKEVEKADRIIREETPAIEASRNLSQHLTEQANEYLDEIEWENYGKIEEVKEMTAYMGYERSK
jgi:geranylgeranyl pyrophosphate synthase